MRNPTPPPEARTKPGWRLAMTACALLLVMMLGLPSSWAQISPPPGVIDEPVPLTAVMFSEPGWYMVKVEPNGDSRTLHLTGLQVDEGQITQRLDAIAARLDTPPEVSPQPTGPFPVDLNTASLDLLQLLPGVGPVLAQRILDLRAARGGYFDSAGDLVAVRGITTAMVEDWDDRGFVAVVPPTQE